MSRHSKIKYTHYFRNENVTENLRKKTLVGGAVFVGSKTIRYVIQICGTIVLARILFPEDFGMIAMVTAITGFFDVFKDAGLGMATIQKKEITHEQMSTLFWFISMISFLLMLCIFATSPVVAWFYGEERLVKITLIFGISVFLGGLGIQHRALLKRRMNFEMIAGVDISVQFLTKVIGICLALLGFGYWALVGMHALQPLIATLLLWFFCPWRPGLPKRGTGVKKMLAFGGYLSFSRIMRYLISNIDNVLIGTVIGTYALGLYSKAYSLMTLPLRQVNLPISNTIMSALSRLQTDIYSFRNYFRKAIFLSTTLTMPIVIFSFVATDEIIYLFLGHKWGGAVPLFKALIPAAFVYTFNGALGWPLIPLGKTRHLFRITTVDGITTILAFFIGIKWGAIGVAAALSSQVIITRPFFLWYSFSNSVIKYSDFFSAIFRPAASSFLAGICLWKLKIIFIENNILLNLFSFLIIYFTLYFIVWITIPGGKKEFKSILSYINIVRSKLPITK
jgi:PST family polysaccharide transporter